MFIGKQIHDLNWEQEEQNSQNQCDAGTDKGGNANGPVDVLQITLAPVLAHQNTETALYTEYDADEQKDRNIGRGDGRHLLVAQLTDHEGVDQAQREGDQVLQNDRQGELPQPFVKAGLPAEKGQCRKKDL